MGGWPVIACNYRTSKSLNPLGMIHDQKRPRPPCLLRCTVLSLPMPLSAPRPTNFLCRCLLTVAAPVQAASAAPGLPACTALFLSESTAPPSPHPRTPPHPTPRLQDWRSDKFFDDVFQLVGVPVITVQLRYNGWVTEMQVSPGHRGAHASTLLRERWTGGGGGSEVQRGRTQPADGCAAGARAPDAWWKVAGKSGPQGSCLAINTSTPGL